MLESPVKTPIGDDSGRPNRLTQAQRRDRSEKELIAATIRIVSEQGVSAATFDAIGKEAGYSRGLVTQRFGSKLGLIRALIDFLYTTQLELLEEQNVSEIDGLSALLALVELHSDEPNSLHETRAYFMLLSHAVADRTDQRQAFEDSHKRERVLIRNLIERGQASGHIRSDVDADAQALATGCALLGLRMQWLIDPGMDVAPVRKELIASLKARLAPGGNAGRAEETRT